MSHVNLKDLVEFNKYTTGLGAGVLVYVDQFEAGQQVIRTIGIAFAAIVVLCGVTVMSVKGRIKGDEIDYIAEPDRARVALFKVVSRALTLQQMCLFVTLGCAAFLSLARIWK